MSLVSPESQTDPRDFSLRLSEDECSMLEPVRRYARERLLPLLGDAASASGRQAALQQAARLGLASAVLPQDCDGLCVDAPAVCLLLEEMAAGPLWLAAEITLSVPALAMRRECEKMGSLLPADAENLFGGSGALPFAVCEPQGDVAFTLLPQAPGGLLALCPGAPDGGHVLRGFGIDELAGMRMQAQAQAQSGQDPLRMVRLHIGSAAGRSPHAFELSQRQLEHGLIWHGLWLAALLAGAARAATTFAFEYARTRVAFQRPIFHHQAVLLRLADMAIATDGLRLLVLDSASRLAVQELTAPHFAEAARHIACTSMEVHRHAVQICGGHGYVEGFPPARRFQDAQLLTLMLLETARVAAALSAPAASPGR
ncbi:acyl-CoA/acyl-ACP dehydrogenase [Paracidovorax citrulli]